MYRTIKYSGIKQEAISKPGCLTFDPQSEYFVLLARPSPYTVLSALRKKSVPKKQKNKKMAKLSRLHILAQPCDLHKSSFAFSLCAGKSPERKIGKGKQENKTLL